MSSVKANAVTPPTAPVEARNIAAFLCGRPDCGLGAPRDVAYWRVVGNRVVVGRSATRHFEHVHARVKRRLRLDGAGKEALMISHCTVALGVIQWKVDEYYKSIGTTSHGNG